MWRWVLVALALAWALVELVSLSVGPVWVWLLVALALAWTLVELVSLSVGPVWVWLLITLVLRREHRIQLQTT